MFAVPRPQLPLYTPTRPTPPVGGDLLTVGLGKMYPATQAGLQAAMDAANRGDIIEISAGETINIGSSPLIMKRKAGSGYVWVRSSAHTAFAPNVRAGASDSSNMATIVKTVGSFGFAMIVEYIESEGETTHSWCWEGIEFTCSHTTGTVSAIISLIRDTVLGFCHSQLWEPHDLYFLHCYIHGDGTHNVAVGLEGTGESCGIWDSTIDDILSNAQDCQAIGIPTGTGNFIADNCRLSATGECFMAGGGYQQISGVQLSDITFRRCEFTWLDAWYGSGYVLKNTFEIKVVDRLLVEDCIIHNCWAAGQTGECLVLKNTTTDSWAVAMNMTFRRCKFYDASGVANLLTIQGIPTVQPGMSDILFDNCVGWNLNREAGHVVSLYEGCFFQHSPSNGTYPNQFMDRVQVRHCTFVHDEPGQSSATSANFLRLTGGSGVEPGCRQWFFRDNVLSMWGASDTIRQGITSTGPPTRTGTTALNALIQNYSFGGNLWIGNYTTGNFPSGNTKAASYAAAGFQNWAAGDLRLSSASPGKGAGQYGGDCGANIPQVDEATAHCLDGDWT